MININVNHGISNSKAFCESFEEMLFDTYCAVNQLRKIIKEYLVDVEDSDIENLIDIAVRTSMK